MLVTYVDYKGYVRTIALKAGERVSEYTKYGMCRPLKIMYKVGDQYSEALDGKDFEELCKGYDFLINRGATLTAEDFRKSLTDNPTRLTPQQTYNDFQDYVSDIENLCDSAYNEETGHYYSVWKQNN